MQTISLLNGPNLNLLGVRKPEIYGTTTLAQIVASVEEKAQALGFKLNSFQSNHEGALVDAIQKAGSDSVGIVINPAAYSHTSIAIRDALEASNLPVVEVHISNIHRREEFRHHSYVSEVAKGVIVGCGAHGYVLAIEALTKIISSSK